MRSVSFSYDSEYVACGSVDKLVSINHVISGTRVRAIQCSGPTNTVAWHPSQHLLAFANDEDIAPGSYSRPTIKVVGVAQ